MSPPCVIVVDDNTVSRTHISRLFALCGVEVIEAEDGPQGLKAFDQCKRNNRLPQIICLDIVMPGMYGTECAQKLRQAGYKGLIAAFTGNATGEGRKMASDSGIDRYLNKQVIKKELLLALLNETGGAT